ncbi:protein FAR1-RELATED SEQUENCE 5-like [Chenopodium quinoa]|uniref:protein FAR1-RELATED SEQUENCE 5-like n=1 Tax=Chenopodium quinoa TaxID=63459 RepID=UPI000B78812D|nr:protein FAR1-RELATED SEQUENCE 5-like [Chenopodium quinoa]
MKSGDWVVKGLELQHKNHVPTPQKSHYIAMYRKEDINAAVRRKLFTDVGSGSKVTQVFNSLASERNGVENVAFTKRDLHNVISRERSEKMKNGDWNALFDYFNAMSADNQNFYHMHRVDKFNQLSDVMWVDARSRAAYEEFGDVIVFDTTYLTDQYDLPFANFVGVNHHGQSILLGCALFSHENAETFEWLFRTWLGCMSNKKPLAILTDQDAAMRKALRNVMPCTRHRWCLWHILTKFSQKLGKYETYELFKVELHNVIYDSLTDDEFEKEWAAAIAKYQLEEDPWLAGLYAERKMWAPAYMRHIFWVGMKTTQRVESINSFFDGFLDKHTWLYEFGPKYIAAMESRANDEQQDDARFCRPLITGFMPEWFFRKIYTVSKFLDVQEQCNRVMYLTPLSKVIDSDDGATVTHTLEDRVWVLFKETRKEFPTQYTRLYHVKINKENTKAFCSCKHFETHGIICRHIIKVLDMHKMTVVPEMFVLNRWRKDVFRKHTRVKVTYHDPSKTVESKRFDEMMVDFEPLCVKASIVADCVPIVIDTLRQLDINMEATVNAAGLSGITLTKKTPPKSTKKSPASSKKKTPKSMNKGKWTVTETGKQSIMDVSPTCFEIGSPSTDLLVNDPVSRKKPHRTPSCMHRSCVEKSKKRTPKRSKSVKKTALHPQVNSDEVLRLSAGGIEMLTENGSVGYFTSTVEEDSDGFVLCGDDDGDVLGMDVDDVGVVGLDGDGGDDLLTQHDLVWV